MGYGRPDIPNRLIRHFNLLVFNEMNEKTQLYVTQRLLSWGFNSYIDKIQLLSKSLGKIALNIYNAIRREFVSIPEKPHYTFNMRDHIKIINGLLKVEKNRYKANDDNKGKLIKLLLNECIAVYKDRFINLDDRSKFDSLVTEQITLQ